MKRRGLRIKTLTPLQQGLLAATLIAGALLLGSALFLAFAIPNGWLVPPPRTSSERDIAAASLAVDEARQRYGTGPTDDGLTPYADAQASLILARLDAGQVERASRDAQQLVADNPDHLLALYAQARALLMSEAFEQAQIAVSTLLGRARELDSELLRSTHDLQAQLYMEAGQQSAAFDSLMSAARITPASIPYFQQAAELALSMNRYDSATTAYGLALAYNPESLAIQNALVSIRNRHAEPFARGLQAASDEVGIDLEALLP